MEKRDQNAVCSPTLMPVCDAPATGLLPGEPPLRATAEALWFLMCEVGPKAKLWNLTVKFGPS